MGTLLQDVRYGLRNLWKAPGFSLVAIFSLALGIGANTTIFSIIDALMLKQLPVHEPERLVLFGSGRAGGIFDGVPDSVQLVSESAFTEIRKQNDAFQDAFGVFSIPLTLHPFVAGSETSEPLRTKLVSGNYFSVLGVNAASGRLFTAAADSPKNTHAELVISYAFWQRRFRGEPSAVGRTMRIGEQIFTIAGVAAPEFTGATTAQPDDAWMPLSMQSSVPPYFKVDPQNDQQLYVVARLKPGVRRETAQAAATVLLRRLMREYAGSTLSSRDRQAIDRMQVDLTPATTGLSNIPESFTVSLRVLTVVVAIVLLIACANVANLLLARSTARQREMAVRFAIGSGRWRIVRQLLTESVLLSLAGGVAGILLAMWGSQALIALVSGGPDPVAIDLAPDARMLAFTFGVSLFTGILFGIAPAFRASSVDANTFLREGRGGTATRGRRSAGRALVVSQVALSLLLLIGAGLFLRSFRNLEQIDTGFNRDQVLVFNVDSDATGMKEDERLSRFYERVEDRVSAVPGVESASFSMFAFHQGQWTQNVAAEGHPEIAAGQKEMWFNAVGTGYLRTLEIPLLRGRFFRRQDNSGSPKVAVLNETAAREIFGNESPLGRHVGNGDPKSGLDIEIIGVVKDARYQRLREKTPWMAYIPFAQKNGFMGNLLVKTQEGRQAAVVAQVRQAIGEIDRNLPISAVSTMGELVNNSIRTQHVIALLSTFFGALALLLAAIGLYGTLSYSVSRRTNEIGVRMALGARRASVVWMVLRETATLVGLGVAIGLPLALVCDRFIESMLFGLKATDAVSIAAAVSVLAVIGLSAGFLPARRASHVDPMVALRYE